MSRPKLENKIPTAADFMNDHVLAFRTDTPIRTAVEKLLKRGFSGAPVVDADNKLVGVLSEMDCLRILSDSAYERWPEGSVEANMTREVEAVPPQTDLFALASRFRAGPHRRFPITDADGKLLGLVTRRDVLRALERFGHDQSKARQSTTYELIAHRRLQQG